MDLLGAPAILRYYRILYDDLICKKCDNNVGIAVDTLVRTWTLLVPRAAGDQQRPNQSGDRYIEQKTTTHQYLSVHNFAQMWRSRSITIG